MGDLVEFYPIVGKMSVPNQNTESVSFKVSLLKENGEKSEVRRFVVPQDCSSSLIYLKEKIRTIFNLGRSNCKVSWKDEDNDDVTIETDEELLIALQELVGPVYKLQVVKTEADFIPDHSNAGNGNTNQENQNKMEKSTMEYLVMDAMVQCKDFGTNVWFVPILTFVAFVRLKVCILDIT